MSYKSYKDLGNNTKLSEEITFKVERVTSEEHRKKIISTNMIVIIDNYTDWCQPCKLIAPKFAKLAQKYNRKCYFLLENNDDEFEGTPPISAVPCFHFYINGNFVNDITIMGGDLEAVESTINKILEKLKKS